LIEARWHDADDRHHTFVGGQRLADDISAAGESPPRERVADDRHRSAACAVIGARKAPPRSRLDLERFEVRGRDRRGVHPLRFTVAHEVDEPRRRDTDGRQLRKVTQRLVVEHRGAEWIETFAQRHTKADAIDIGNRERSQQQRRDRAVDRGRRADADGEGQDGERADAGCLPEDPNSLAKIVAERVHAAATSQPRAECALAARC
jgi:hypothetical protein